VRKRRDEGMKRERWKPQVQSGQQRGELEDRNWCRGPADRRRRRVREWRMGSMAAGSEQNFEVLPTTGGAEESEGDSCGQDM